MLIILFLLSLIFFTYSAYLYGREVERNKWIRINRKLITQHESTMSRLIGKENLANAMKDVDIDKAT